MNDFYSTIDHIIKEELDNGHKIAIYPLGRIGLEAKNILENRYGTTAVYVDNTICNYNSKVISFAEFSKLEVEYVVLICVENPELNRTLANSIKKIEGVGHRVRSCLEANVVVCLEKEEQFRDIKSLCRVYKAIGHNLTRIGAEGDGGYVMLDDFNPTYRAYSFGIGNDISWDEDILNRGIATFCYDHTIEKLPKNGTGLLFHKFGINKDDNIEKKLLSMDTILINNNEKSNDLILKMDVEGAEWDFLDTVKEETLCRFRQMTFEFHDMTDSENLLLHIRVFEKLNKYFLPVWIHANNARGVERAVKTEIPPLLEITYVRKESYELIPIRYSTPIEIDYPNVSTLWDIELKGWGASE